MTGPPRRWKARKERAPPADLSRARDRFQWEVCPEEHGMRLDQWLQKRLDWRSRTAIVALIREGRVLHHGRTAGRKSAKVLQGDRIAVLIPPPVEEERHAELAARLAARIVWEDEHLVVVDKPPNLVVHPVGRVQVNTLIQGLHWLYRHVRPEPATIPRICHRLDRETSGLLVVAKSFPARSALQHAFQEHAVEKEYAAVVTGRIAQDRGTIDAPIGRDEAAAHETAMTVRPDGQEARTDWEVLERFREASLVRFTLHTGRQHQIRVHARALGHPVLLDPLYGDGPRRWPAGAASPVIARVALHARRLAFDHPRRRGLRIECEAALPEDFLALLAALRGPAGTR